MSIENKYGCNLIKARFTHYLKNLSFRRSSTLDKQTRWSIAIYIVATVQIHHWVNTGNLCRTYVSNRLLPKNSKGFQKKNILCNSASYVSSINTEIYKVFNRCQLCKYHFTTLVVWFACC